MMEGEEYLQEFLQEAREYMDVMAQRFIDVENGDLDAINEVFRIAHTIKGMAGFMGFRNLENLCHKLETVMGFVRDGKIQISNELVDLLLKSVDVMNEILSKIEESGTDDVDLRIILEELETISSGSEEAVYEIEKVEKADLRVEDANILLEIELADDCAMKSVRTMLILENLSEIAQIVETVPPRDELEAGDFDSFKVYLKGDAGKVRDVMERMSELKSYLISELGKDQKKENSAKNTPSRDSVKLNKKSDSIRVNISTLDTIMDLVGELVIIKGRLMQIASQHNLGELTEAVSSMSKFISRLQEEVMRTRMVKVERVFNKFPKMVRDLSRKLGKKVHFEMEGLDTELDRTVLDEISDPLIHLIRNAVDHGIEPPDERKMAGKSEEGFIKLSARRDKNNIVIEIEDDGRGIDVERVKKKAVERGIISESEAENMSESDIMMLIFSPGFSTKDKATEISGRGVGMDVVKTTVEKLGGSIKLISEKGKGTKIRIVLPPTLAIIRALLVRVDNQIYAIPLSNVVEAVYVNGNFRNLKDSPVLYVRGNIIPAFRLRELFNIGGGDGGMEVGVIVERENEKYALIADEIMGQQEIVVKPLTGFLSKVKGFSGVTILGDGRIVPIIDVSTVI